MAALPDDIVEEILLRMPPDEPTLLVRTALACRQWCRLVSSSGFRRKFRARHRNPPTLVALCNFTAADDGVSIVRFVPGRSSSLTPRERRGWRAIDSRHGRVLLQSWRGRFASLTALAVWNPLTDHLRELPLLQRLTWPGLNATVVCAVTAGDCDHLDCTSFIVALLGSDRKGMFAYLYSSIADTWSEPTYLPWQWRDSRHYWRQRRVQRVGNDLYFLVMYPLTILKYDLVTRELTVINPPPPREHNLIFLSTMEGGGLGCVMVKRYRLYMWSREAGPDGEMRWVQTRVIDIRTLVPAGHSLTSIRVSNDRGAIYIETDCGVFAMVHIELGQARLVQGVPGADTVVPYKGFYTPVLEVASTRVDQRELAQAHETTQADSKGLLIDQEGSVYGELARDL